jgi:hypothetical protein
MSKARVRWVEKTNCEGYLSNEEPTYRPQAILIQTEEGGIQVTEEGGRVRPAKKLHPDTELFPLDGPITGRLRSDALAAGYKLATYYTPGE